MIKPKLLLSLFCICLWSASGTYAQTPQKDSVDIHEMSLEELMKIPIQVSKSDLNIREVPSVISVITRDQILNMGARDLTDVLNQIPGFTLGLDGLGLVGLGVRGNWSHEGKVLLLIDGQEANDLLFGSNHYGQHYDIGNIDRIEIIRGPGSAIYGGYAELGVISIITRKGKDIKGIGISGLYGATSNATTRAVTNFSMGNAKGKVDYSLSGQYGSGLRSDDKAYTDIYGNTADLTKNSHLRPLTLNGSLNIGGFSARVLLDKYQLETIDGFDAIFNKAELQKFTYVITDVKYNWKVSDKLQITPRMNMRYGSPYNTSAESTNFPYVVESRRLAPSINMNWTPSNKVSVVAGADSYFDHAKSNGLSKTYFLNLGGGNETSPLYDIGLFAQGVIKTKGFNITIGSRFDQHNLFGSAFSPRIGITRAFEKFHFKALYSRAFRAPAIEYLNYSPNIRPEKAGVTEIELGTKLSDQLWITGNFFHMLIDGPIIFQPDISIPIGGYYSNISTTGSMGFELSLQGKYSWGYFNANYSYYTGKGINQQPSYLPPADDSQSLGFPSNRVNLSGHIKLTTGLSLNPSFNLLGSRYAITTVDGSGAYVYTKLSSEFFANLFLRYAKDNFSCGVGVFDVFDQRQKFVQAYAAGHAPLPGIGREFSVRVAYRLGF